MNYLFPLLPAPGADDDGSGTVAILEALRVLARSGYTPRGGAVEFHWYAAEEGGNLGSQAVARYKRESGARIGAMLEFVSSSIRLFSFSGEGGIVFPTDIMPVQPEILTTSLRAPE